MSAPEPKTILFVEDEPINALAGSMVIKRFGYNVVTANTGEAAVEIALSDGNISLVLMDIDLGKGIDGPEAGRRILKERNIPIVFLTSHSEKEYVDRVKEITRYGYVIKNSGDFVLRSSIEMAFEMFDANRKMAAELQERKRAEEALRQSELRLAGLLELSNMSAQSEKTLTDFALEKAIEITGSTIGYLAFLSEDESVLNMYSWSKSAMSECAIENKPIVYHVEKTGLWGEAIRQRRPVITNDYKADNPLKKGCPEGHVRLERHMNIPLFDADKIVLIAGVGNKKEPYGSDDVNQMKLLMDGMWKIIKTRRAEEAMADSRRMYQTFINSTNDMAFLKDENFRYMIINQTNADFFGKKPEEIIGLTDFDLMDPNSAKYCRESDEKAIRDNKIIINEEKVGDRVYETRKFPVEMRNGKIGVGGYIRDITERKDVEKELTRHQGLLSTIIESTSEAIFAKEKDGKYHSINEAGARMLGYSAAEVIGRTDMELLPAETAAEFRKTDEFVMSNDRVYEREESGMIGGKQCIFLAHKAPWRDSGGKIFGVIGISNDITERKRMEDELRSSRKRLKDIIEFLPDATLAIDNNRRIIIWNKAIEKMTGFQASEMIGKGDNYYAIPFYGYARHSLMDYIFADQNELVKYYSNIVREGDTLIVEVFCNALYNNKGAWVLAKASPLYDQDGNVVGAIESIRDITERKMAEGKIKTLLDEKEILLREVHHRIKNNMNTVAGLMMMQADALTEPSAVAALNDARSRVLSMMLLYDKLYHSDDFKQMSFRDYILVLVDEIVANFPNKFMVKIEKNIDDFVIDSKRLSHLGIIFNEILTNIMKYAFKGRDHGSIDVSATVTGDRVTIVVQDDGTGFPDSAANASTEGFGLQLVDLLTKQLRGSTKIERNHGTKFILEFEK